MNQNPIHDEQIIKWIKANAVGMLNYLPQKDIYDKYAAWVGNPNRTYTKTMFGRVLGLHGFKRVSIRSRLSSKPYKSWQHNDIRGLEYVDKQVTRRKTRMCPLCDCGRVVDSKEMGELIEYAGELDLIDASRVAHSTLFTSDNEETI